MLLTGAPGRDNLVKTLPLSSKGMKIIGVAGEASCQPDNPFKAANS